MKISNLKMFGKSLNWIVGLGGKHVDTLYTSDNGLTVTTPPQEVEDVPLDEANIFVSLGHDGRHRLMFDVDDPEVYIRESSTPGHFHIVFPNPIDVDDYEHLMNILYRARIMKEGNYLSYQSLGYFSLRTPWTKKGDIPVKKLGPSSDPVPVYRPDEDVAGL